MRFFHVIKKQQLFFGQAALEKLSDIEGYFTMTIIQYSDDRKKEEYNETRFGVRKCTQDDFGDSEYSKELFKFWEESEEILACPDIDKDSYLTFMGTHYSAIKQYIGVKFEKCRGNNCKYGMDEWLRNVQIDQWVIEEMIDQTKYIGRPTIQTQKRINSHIFAEALIG